MYAIPLISPPSIFKLHYGFQNNFSTLVMRKELDRRLSASGRAFECFEIKTDKTMPGKNNIHTGRHFRVK